MNQRSERIFGLHAVLQMLQNAPDRARSIWIQQSLKSESINTIRSRANELGLSIQSVTRVGLDRMSNKQNHQGVLLEISRTHNATEYDLDDIIQAAESSNPLYLILDSIQDPHNLGACIRTADAAGVTAVIIPKDRAAGINETVRKVASGAVENVAVVSVVNLVRQIRKLKQAGVWIVGMVGDVSRSVYDLDLKAPTAIVMGAEAKGIRESIKKECDYLASIPIKGQIESLNVSVATGVALYEVVRQGLKP